MQKESCRQVPTIERALYLLKQAKANLLPGEEGSRIFKEIDLFLCEPFRDVEYPFQVEIKDYNTQAPDDVLGIDKKNLPQLAHDVLTALTKPPIRWAANAALQAVSMATKNCRNVQEVGWCINMYFNCLNEMSSTSNQADLVSFLKDALNKIKV